MQTSSERRGNRTQLVPNFFHEVAKYCPTQVTAAPTCELRFETEKGRFLCPNAPQYCARRRLGLARRPRRDGHGLPWRYIGDLQLCSDRVRPCICQLRAE